MEGKEMTAAEILLEALGGRNGPSVPSLAPTRAYAWARVSVDKKGDRGVTIPEQLHGIREYAEKNKIEIVSEFSEVASAFQHEERRVEFHRMLAQARSDSTVNAIVVHDLSRF